MARMVTAATLSSVSSCLITNAIVFHLKGAALLLYMAIAALSGVICGIIASWTWEKLIVIAKKR